MKTALAISGLLAVVSLAQAELTYRPAQGNDPGLLSQRFQRATVEDTSRSPMAAARRPARTSIERFEEELQEALLRDVSRATTSNLGLLDDEGQLIEFDGTRLLQIGDFELRFTETDGELTIFARDAGSSEFTQININNQE
ncbi:curli assembly protein CsgF [Spiribacter pallidus]|uniref:Curli production assembly/transport component CsgF n=1 Tax=Spiribacter pallidus TaxID=1987936 RepID=A0ABV3TCY5_9GAMM